MKRTPNQIIDNAAWIIACRLVQAVLNLFVSILTARFLGPAHFGVLNYAQSITAFLCPVMQLGFHGILVHELITDKDREGEILGTALASCLISAVMCMGAAAAFALVSSYGARTTVMVCVLYSLLLPAQALELMRYWFQAHLRSKYPSLISLCAYLVVAGYKIYLLAARKSVYWFAVSNALDCFLIAVLQLVLYRRLHGQKLVFSAQRFRHLFAAGKYYILSGLMVAVFSQTDRMMLELMIGSEATGLYSAAVRCANVTAFVFTAVISSASPVLYASRTEGCEPFEDNVRRLYGIVLYMALAQSLVMAIFAGPIVRILYGSAYAGAIPVLRMVTWYIGFSYMGVIRNRWMLAEHRQHLIWRIDAAGAAANVVLNLLLIPRFGMMGAAAATLMTQFFTNFIAGWICREIRRNNVLMMQGLNPRVLWNLIF